MYMKLQNSYCYVCYNYKLKLCSKLLEESPAWYCFHLLEMIQDFSLPSFINHS